MNVWPKHEDRDDMKLKCFFYESSFPGQIKSKLDLHPYPAIVANEGYRLLTENMQQYLTILVVTCILGGVVDPQIYTLPTSS